MLRYVSKLYAREARNLTGLGHKTAPALSQIAIFLNFSAKPRSIRKITPQLFTVLLIKVTHVFSSQMEIGFSFITLTLKKIAPIWTFATNLHQADWQLSACKLFGILCIAFKILSLKIVERLLLKVGQRTKCLILSTGLRNLNNNHPFDQSTCSIFDPSWTEASRSQCAHIAE